MEPLDSRLHTLVRSAGNWLIAKAQRTKPTSRLPSSSEVGPRVGCGNGLTLAETQRAYGLLLSEYSSACERGIPMSVRERYRKKISRLEADLRHHALRPTPSPSGANAAANSSTRPGRLSVSQCVQEAGKGERR